MPLCAMCRRVALLRTNVLEECIVSIIRVERISVVVFLRSMLQLIVTANVVPSSLILSI
jgi:hypothetical protein